MTEPMTPTQQDDALLAHYTEKEAAIKMHFKKGPEKPKEAVAPAPEEENIAAPPPKEDYVDDEDESELVERITRDGESRLVAWPGSALDTLSPADSEMRIERGQQAHDMVNLGVRRADQLSDDENDDITYAMMKLRQDEKARGETDPAKEVKKIRSTAAKQMELEYMDQMVGMSKEEKEAMRERGNQVLDEIKYNKLPLSEMTHEQQRDAIHAKKYSDLEDPGGEIDLQSQKFQKLYADYIEQTRGNFKASPKEVFEKMKEDMEATGNEILLKLTPEPGSLLERTATGLANTKLAYLDEVPEQALYGGQLAVTETAKFIHSAGDWVRANSAVVAAIDKVIDGGIKFKLPEKPKEAEHWPGELTRGLTQFLASYLPVSRIAGGLRSAAGIAAGSSFTAATAYDPDEHRLIDLVLGNDPEKDTEVQALIRKYLGTKPGDREATKRLKSAVEMLYVGKVLEVVIKGAGAAKRYVVDKYVDKLHRFDGKRTSDAFGIQITQELPKVKKGMARLYRADLEEYLRTNNKQERRQKIQELRDNGHLIIANEKEARLDLEGRWFTQDPKYAAFYEDRYEGDGLIYYVDIPAKDVAQFRISNTKRSKDVDFPQTPRDISGDPRNEYVLPIETAETMKPVDSIPTPLVDAAVKYAKFLRDHVLVKPFLNEVGAINFPIIGAATDVKKAVEQIYAHAEAEIASARKALSLQDANAKAAARIADEGATDVAEYIMNIQIGKGFSLIDTKVALKIGDEHGSMVMRLGQEYITAAEAGKATPQMEEAYIEQFVKAKLLLTKVRKMASFSSRQLEAWRRMMGEEGFGEVSKKMADVLDVLSGGNKVNDLSSKAIQGIKETVDKELSTILQLIEETAPRDADGFIIRGKTFYEHVAREMEKADIAQSFSKETLTIQQLRELSPDAAHAVLGEEAAAELIAAETKQILKDMPKTANGKVDVLKIAKQISQVPTPEALTKLLTKTSLWEKGWKLFFEHWYSSMLSHPALHTLNVLGGLGLHGLNIATTQVAWGIGKLTGPGEKVAGQEAIQMVFSSFMGAIEAIKISGKAFYHGKPSGNFKLGEILKEDPAITAQNFGLEPTGFWGKAIDLLGKIVRLPMRAMMAEDQGTKALGYGSKLYGLAIRQATNEGKTGIELAERIEHFTRNPSQKMINEAKAYANEITLTDDLKKYGINFQQFLKDKPQFKLLMPYVQTPTNGIKTAGQYTVLSVATDSFAAEMAAGGARRDMAIAKATLGTAISAIAWTLSDAGLITGTGPINRDEAATWKRMGWTPLSIKVGDTYVGFGRLDPFNMILGFSGSIAELDKYAAIANMSEQDQQRWDIERSELAKDIAVVTSKVITEKSTLMTLVNVLDVLTAAPGAGKKLYHNMIASLPPFSGAAKAANQMFNPELKKISNAIDALKSRYPGLSDKIPAEVDLWGKTLMPNFRTWWTPLIPITVSKATPNPVDDEFARLRMHINLPTNNIGMIELEPIEHHRYKVLAGEKSLELVTKLMQGGRYTRASDTLRESLIGNEIMRARAIAQRQMKKEYPDLAQAIKQKEHAYIKAKVAGTNPDAPKLNFPQ